MATISKVRVDGITINIPEKIKVKGVEYNTSDIDNIEIENVEYDLSTSSSS